MSKSCSSPAPAIKIMYFPVRAKTETGKLILSYGGVPFEDVPYREYFDGKAWPDIKKSGACPFGQLPVVEVGGNGKLLSQTGAINRYFAKVADLMPEDALDAAYCDAIYEAAMEMSLSPSNINPIVNVFTGEKFEGEKTTFLTDFFPTKLANLSKQLGEKEYFCGSLPYFCDFAVWHHLDLAILLDPSSLDACPNMKPFYDRVAALRGVKEYLAGRPDCVDIGTKPMLKPKL